MRLACGTEARIGPGMNRQLLDANSTDGSKNHNDDEEVDDLLRVAFDVENEWIGDVGWWSDDHDNLALRRHVQHARATKPAVPMVSG